MNPILVILMVLLLFGGGGYYGYNAFGEVGLGWALGLVLLILLVLWFTGALRSKSGLT